MIHTVYLDDEHVNGRKLLKEIRRYKRGVRFKNPAVGAIAPEGYMTGEEFRKLAVAKVNKFCDEHGLL
jgi:hypothetical protein